MQSFSGQGRGVGRSIVHALREGGVSAQDPTVHKSKQSLPLQRQQQQEHQQGQCQDQNRLTSVQILQQLMDERARGGPQGMGVGAQGEGQQEAEGSSSSSSSSSGNGSNFRDNEGGAKGEWLVLADTPMVSLLLEWLIGCGEEAFIRQCACMCVCVCVCACVFVYVCVCGCVCVCVFLDRCAKITCEICAGKCSPLLAQNGSPRCHFVLVREVCFDDCLVKAAPFYLKQTCFSTMLKTWRAFLGQCHVKHCIPAFDCLPLCRDSWVDLGWHASSDIVVGEESAGS